MVVLAIVDVVSRCFPFLTVLTQHNAGSPLNSLLSMNKAPKFLKRKRTAHTANVPSAVGKVYHILL